MPARHEDRDPGIVATHQSVLSTSDRCRSQAPAHHFVIRQSREREFRHLTYGGIDRDLCRHDDRGMAFSSVGSGSKVPLPSVHPSRTRDSHATIPPAQAGKWATRRTIAATTLTMEAAARDHTDREEEGWSSGTVR